MKQLIEYIVSNLVNHPEDVVIEEQSTEDSDLTLINIQVNPEDIGRVIGKSGKVIKAIRQITRIAAIQKGLKIRVDLVDQDAPARPSTPQAETTNEVQPVDEVKAEAPQAETTNEVQPVDEVEKDTPQVEVETEAPQAEVETVDENETGKQVYPEPETLEAEPEKEIK